TSLERGDALLLAMGDLVPVDSTLEAACELRLDWINGESEPRAFEAGERAPAGAFLASAVAVRARCLTGFADSALVELLTTPERDRGDRWFDRLGRVYVALVLLAAAGAFGIWIVIGDLTSALSVTTAVLVVSCPCAFGIAAPLAFDLVQASLRQAGVFVRSPSLLSRMRGVRRAVFDKTGTLTTGTPRLADPSALEPLDGRARAALYDLAASSAHPKARAILAHLDGALTPGVIVHEVTSSGLELWRDGHRYRLGRPAWASPERAFDPAIDLVFSEDARPLAALRTREALRPAVREELAALREAGLEVFVLSGDSGEKVAALARELGLPEDHAIGGCTSEDKASWIRAHDPDRTLFVGDGINDALAADAALVSGTPAVETPFMAARTDFYFVGSRVAPIAALFDHARRLRRVLNVILTIAVLYNAGAVTLAYLGLIEPWVAAVLMPASSIVTIAVATLGLRSARSRRSTWKP
ncbi:MAG: HAD-IC family P-type ATPase, partial [Sandaracinaceae bacterium]